jgi:hypothetical protein
MKISTGRNKQENTKACTNDWNHRLLKSLGPGEPENREISASKTKTLPQGSHYTLLTTTPLGMLGYFSTFK